MSKHPDECDCDLCPYSEEVQKGMMHALMAEQVEDGYFDK